jgi:LuxR family maltose regulon positive regulatory protein
MGEPASTGPVRAGDGLDEAGVPRLPRTYVPRHDLWRRLDAAADSAVVTLVAPAGAGKTLGVAGWLRNAPVRTTSGDVAWLDAGRGLDDTALDAALDAAAEDPEGDHGGPPRLVVIDDAHTLPASAVRLLDTRLNDAPRSMRVLLLCRWDLPISRLAAG